MNWWEYDALPSRAPYDWSPATKGDRPWDNLDFHLDLGCGRVPKARMGIDLRPSPGATDLAIDFETLMPAFRSTAFPNDRYDFTDDQRAVLRRTREHYRSFREGLGQSALPPCLPFPDGSIRSIVTHHCFEHVGPGFQALMEECYRVLAWDGVMRIVVPLFPSYTAVAEYDHKRYFMEGTFNGFCQEVNGGTSMYDGFSERYNTCCFKLLDEDMTAPTEPEKQWTPEDAREIRVTLWKNEHPEDTPPEAQDRKDFVG